MVISLLSMRHNLEWQHQLTAGTKCFIIKDVLVWSNRQMAYWLQPYCTLPSDTILWAILSNILAVWQRLTCSVRERPLYQSSPAAQLKITSSHGSHKINLYSEERCPQYNDKDVSEQCSLSFDFRGIRGVCRWNSLQSLHNSNSAFQALPCYL